MRRQFLTSSALVVAAISGLPIKKFNFNPQNKTTFFHINSQLPFWKNEAARETLLNIVSQNSLPMTTFAAPALSITINQDHPEHVAIYQKVSKRLQAAQIDHNVIFLSEKAFWDNWTSYEFTFIDWITNDRTESALADLMISANSNLCMENAQLLSSTSSVSSSNPFCFLATPV